MRVLVVEHPEVAGFIAEGLRDGGHAVDVASDGEDGLTLGLSGGYDIILLALILPKRDGIQVGSALRRAGHSVPILLLTPDEHDVERVVRQAGADGYLVKPFPFDRLLGWLRALGPGGV